jgi:hypothetical protein
LLPASAFAATETMPSLTRQLSGLDDHILLTMGLASGATLRLTDAPHVGSVSPRTGPVDGATLAAGLDLPEDAVAESLQALRAAGLIRRSNRADELLFEDASLARWRAFEHHSQVLTRALIWRLRMANIIPMLDKSDARPLTMSRRPVVL